MGLKKKAHVIDVTFSELIGLGSTLGRTHTQFRYASKMSLNLAIQNKKTFILYD